MFRQFLPFVTALTILANATASAEVIGDFKIVAAPIAATQTGGPSIATSWLNVAPVPVTVAEGFTRFSLIDDGFRVNAGVAIDLFFEPSLVQNRPGPDLVLLDANPGLNVYLVTVFLHEAGIIRSVGAITDTHVTRDYYTSAGGPTQQSIIAATIDLSMFAIPDGGDVDHIRVFSEGPDCAPLGVGVLLSTCPQDITGDGVIDLADLSLLLASFGSSYGEEGFIPYADLDADGSIGLADLADLLSRFGGAC